jgi:hypothetical protein
MLSNRGSISDARTGLLGLKEDAARPSLRNDMLDTGERRGAISVRCEMWKRDGRGLQWVSANETLQSRFDLLLFG